MVSDLAHFLKHYFQYKMYTYETVSLHARRVNMHFSRILGRGKHIF